MPTQRNAVTPSSIMDQFIDNVNNIILVGLRHQSNVPSFSGSVEYNSPYTTPSTDPPTPSTYATAYSNPTAIPSNDLDSLGSAAVSSAAIGATGNAITGSTVYDTLCAITKKLTRVRNFTSAWYHKTGTTNALVTSVTGRAIFREVLPALPASNIADNAATSGWTRSVNGDATQNIAVTNPGISKGTAVTADNINTFFTNLNTSWTAAAGNSVDYTFYSCHANCHTSCHTSCHSSGRARR
jgi:hypothetical protein